MRGTENGRGHGRCRVASPLMSGVRTAGLAATLVAGAVPRRARAGLPTNHRTNLPNGPVPALDPSSTVKAAAPW